MLKLIKKPEVVLFMLPEEAIIYAKTMEHNKALVILVADSINRLSELLEEPIDEFYKKHKIDPEKHKPAKNGICFVSDVIEFDDLERIIEDDAESTINAGTYYNTKQCKIAINKKIVDYYRAIRIQRKESEKRLKRVLVNLYGSEVLDENGIKILENIMKMGNKNN